jgi:hypothetical protein
MTKNPPIVATRRAIANPADKEPKPVELPLAMLCKAPANNACAAEIPTAAAWGVQALL